MITEDRIWGFVLIALGLASIAFHPFDKIGAWLKGSADESLSVALVLLAVMVVVIAIKAPPTTKAVVLAWIVTP